MISKVQVIPVQQQIEEQLRRAIAVFREEVKAKDPSITDSDIVIEHQDQRGMFGGGVGEVFLYVAGTIAAGITKKWIEEILWPKVKIILEKPSNEVLDALLKIPDEGGKDR